MSSQTAEIIGWDIGGVHTKAVRLQEGSVLPAHPRACSRPFEIWRAPERLPQVLVEVGQALGATQAAAMALTMTAELSDVFRCKREGVLHVLAALEDAFPQIPCFALSLTGVLEPLDDARAHPLDFAASNWLASALFVARRYANCLLVDVGSTTTDIIPVVDGFVATAGHTDTARLASGELVYTGVLRTNPCSIARHVPLDGQWCQVSSELFTTMADVYLLLGHVTAETYTTPTADGRNKDDQAARERLARLVCADREALTEPALTNVARYLHEQQLAQLSQALFQVMSRWAGPQAPLLVLAGTGRFLGSELGRRLGLQSIDLGDEWGEDAISVLPALAAASLLAEPPSPAAGPGVREAK